MKMGRLPHHGEALLAALQFRNSSMEGLQELQESQWHDLLWLSDLMHLTLPLGQVCGDDLPRWVHERIDHNLADNSQRFARTKAVYSELAKGLREANVECLVIKGFAQYPDYVENPRLRAQSDIDLFCPPETIYRARDVLVGLGYQPDRRLEHLPERPPCSDGPEIQLAVERKLLRS